MKMMIIGQYRQNWGEQGTTASRPRPGHLFPSSAVPSCVKLPQRRWSRLVRSGIAHFDHKWQKRSRNPKLRSSDFWWPLPWLSCYLLGLLGRFGPTPPWLTWPVWDAGLHQSCHLQPLHFLAILMVNWRGAKMMIIYDEPGKKIHSLKGTNPFGPLRQLEFFGVNICCLIWFWEGLLQFSWLEVHRSGTVGCFESFAEIHIHHPRCTPIERRTATAAGAVTTWTLPDFGLGQMDLKMRDIYT